MSRDIYQNFDADPAEMNDAEFLRRWMAWGFDDPIWYQSVIVQSRYEKGEVPEIRLDPVELGYELRGPHRGLLRMAPLERAQQTLETLRRLSGPFGTEIQIQDGVGVIRQPAAAGLSGG